MKASLAVLTVVISVAVVLALALPAASFADPSCEVHSHLCPDPGARQNYEGGYVGHDEPAILFYSTRAGAGNSNVWRLRLPREAPTSPTQDGTGGTWNFQRSAAFWFGMDLCETQSYPNPGLPCPAGSDTNIKDDPDPSSPNWMGNHVGTGFLEMQFYPPGWAPLPAGISCDSTRWCAAMAVFGLSDSLTQVNNTDCLARAGEEWVNFAYITTNGVPIAPPDPIAGNAWGHVDASRVLMMKPGDDLTISIHDSPAGLVNSITDLTSGQSGFMTASVANGFMHPLFQPSAKTCSQAPYAFHPMYSTSTEHTNVPWTVHTYNVSFSDEIGHFEYCGHATAAGGCSTPGVTDAKKDADDSFCLNAGASLLVAVTGCTGTDADFDGTSYQPDWAGTLVDPSQDAKLHSESFLFTSPLTGGRDYDRMAFEADLPAIEPLSICAYDGTGCVNPPPGAQFYPIYSTRTGQGACGWQEGGTNIPGTSNTFGGNSTAEYGPLLLTYFPGLAYFPAGTYANNYRKTLSINPCPSAGRLPR